MKIHSDTLTGADLEGALCAARSAEHITPDVHFVVFGQAGSRSHRAAHEVQLGTYDKTTGPTKSRHYKNSGTHGADSVWAATYDEWGWFLAEVYRRDASAMAGPYKSRDDFGEKTKHAYDLASV